MADESLTFRAFGQDVSAGRMFKDLGDKADDAGDSVHSLGDESKSLDTRLDETREHLRALIAEFNKTGDASLFRDIRRDRSTISLLETLRKEASIRIGRGPEGPGRGSESDGEDVGRRFGKGVTKGLGDTIGALPSQLKGAAIIGLVGAAAAAAPAVGAAIAGAVVGGVGLGGIAGGIALAAQDSRVQSAASKLGDILLADLQSAGSPFIAPLLSQFGELQEIGESFIVDLRKGFVQLAPLIGPLVEGVRGFQRNLGPGLADVFEAARPAIRALANELPEIGDAISDVLSDLSKSGRATEGMLALLDAIEGVTRATGFFVGYLEYQFDWLVQNGAEVDKFKDRLGPLAATWGLTTSLFLDETSNIKEGLGKANDATLDWEGSLRDLRDTTEEDAAKLANFNDEIDKYLGKTLGVTEAQIRLKEQWADTVETLKDGKRTLDINTEAGRDNEKALIDLIKAAEDVRTAEYNKTGSLDTANQAYDRQLERLRNLAIKLHFSKAEVDKLIESVKTGNAIGGLTVPVTMPGLDRYTARLNYYIQQLGVVRGLAAAEFATHREGERNPSARALGGPVMAGRTYRVGENGPEIVTFGANGNVISNEQSRAMLSGASGGGTVDVNVRIDPSGAHDAIAQAIAQILRVDAAFRATVAGYVGASA